MWTARLGQVPDCVCANAARPNKPGANADAAESAIKLRRVNMGHTPAVVAID